MGNKLGRRHQVDDKYTRPQGLYHHKDVDYKKLRKLILESKLAPCYLGGDNCTNDLEECPICFLYYPSLNRSRCCMKSICTECFLQMKTPNLARPTQCPFCKTANYAVEYRGTKTKEEKGLEQLEEQRVIEAQIRMRQQEMHDEETKTLERYEIESTSHAIMSAGDNESNLIAEPSSTEEMLSAQMSSVTSRPLLQSRQARDDEFDVDLEDIMVMEAIWLSIRDKDIASEDPAPERYSSNNPYAPPVMLPLAESSSPCGGVACAIAALAKRQQVGGESSTSCNSDTLVAHERMVSDRAEQEMFYPLPELPAPGNSMSVRRDDGYWSLDPGSEVAEAGTSYCSSEVAYESGGFSLSVPPQDAEVMGCFPNLGGAGIIPDTYEEQLMLAIAVSLTDARAMTSAQGMTRR